MMQQNYILNQQGLKPSRSSHQLHGYQDHSYQYKYNQVKPHGDDDSCDDHLSVYDEAYYSGNNAADLVPPSYISRIKKTMETSPGKDGSNSDSPNSKNQNDRPSILRNGSGEKRNRNNNNSQVSFDTANILNTSTNNQNNVSVNNSNTNLYTNPNMGPKPISNFTSLQVRPCDNNISGYEFQNMQYPNQYNPNQLYTNPTVNSSQQQQTSLNFRKSTDQNPLNTQGSRSNLYDVSSKYMNFHQTCKNPVQTSQNGSKYGSTYEYDLKRNSSLGQILKQDSELSYLKQSEYIKKLEQNSKMQTQMISKEHQDDYSKKLWDQSMIYKNKKQALVEEVKKKEMSECTFAPKINDYGSRRSNEQFCELQNQFIQYVQEKKQMVKDHVEEQRMAEVTDRPRILQKSKQIMEQKRMSEIPAYARLYYLHKKEGGNNENVDSSNQNMTINKGNSSYITNVANNQEKYYKNKDNYEQIRHQNQEKEQKENTFKPVIHQKSKSLIRNEKVEVILYKDAKRRQDKQRAESKKRSRSSNSCKMSQQSEIILIQKFTKEFNQICSLLELKDKEHLELTNVFELLIKQGFIRYYYEQDGPVIENEKRLVFLLWSLIGGEKFGRIKKENLVIFLLCVLGLGTGKNVGEREIEQILKNSFQQYTGNQGNLSAIASQFFNQNNNPSSRIQTEPGVSGANRMHGDDQFTQSISPHKLIQAAQQINSGMYEINSSNSKSNQNNTTPFNATFSNPLNQNMFNPGLGSNNSGLKSKTSLDVNKDANSNTNISFQGIGGKQSFSGQKLMQNINGIEQVRIDEIPEGEHEQSKAHRNFTTDKKLEQQIAGSNIFNNEISKSIYNIQIGYFDEETKLWVLGQDDKRVIHQAFEVLYRNKLAYEELKNNKHDWEYSFQPQLTVNSINLANKQREKVLTEAAHLLETQQIKMKIPEDGKICHQQLLVLQKLAQQQQTQKKKEALEKEELRECSFQPQTQTLKKVNSSLKVHTLPDMTTQEKGNMNIYDPAQAAFINENQSNSKSRLATIQSIERGNKKTEELFQQPHPKLHRRDKTREEIEYEKVCDECTFHPEITKGKRVYKQEQLYAKNIDKTIDRMRNAQKDREQINLAKQRGYTRHSLGGIDEFKPESTKHSKMSSNNLSNLKSPTSIHNLSSNKPPMPQSTSNRNMGKSANNLSGQFQYDQNTNSLNNQNTNTMSNNNNQSSFLQDKTINQNIDDQILLSSKNQTDSSFTTNQQMLQQQQLQQYHNQMQQQQQYYSSINSQKNQNNAQQNPLQYSSSQSSSDSQQSNNSRPMYQQNSPSPSKMTNVMQQSNKQNEYTQPQSSQAMNIQELYVQNQSQTQSQQKLQMPSQTTSQHSNNSISQDPAYMQPPSYANSTYQDKMVPGNNNNLNVNQNMLIPDNSSSQTPNKSATSSTSQYIKSEEKVPLLFVDVNLGLGRTERIVVYEGDKSEDLANKFAQVHNLDAVTKQKFKELLDNQIAGLLSRIDEEEMLSYESESQNHSAILQQHYYFQNYNGSHNQLPQSSSQKNLLNQPQNNSQYNSLNGSHQLGRFPYQYSN